MIAANKKSETGLNNQQTISRVTFVYYEVVVLFISSIFFIFYFTVLLFSVMLCASSDCFIFRVSFWMRTELAFLLLVR